MNFIIHLIKHESVGVAVSHLALYDYLVIKRLPFHKETTVQILLCKEEKWYYPKFLIAESQLMIHDWTYYLDNGNIWLYVCIHHIILPEFTTDPSPAPWQLLFRCNAPTKWTDNNEKQVSTHLPVWNGLAVCTQEVTQAQQRPSWQNCSISYCLRKIIRH